MGLKRAGWVVATAGREAAGGGGGRCGDVAADLGEGVAEFLGFLVGEEGLVAHVEFRGELGEGAPVGRAFGIDELLAEGVMAEAGEGGPFERTVAFVGLE